MKKIALIGAALALTTGSPALIDSSLEPSYVRLEPALPLLNGCF